MLLSAIPKHIKGTMLPALTPASMLATLHDASTALARCHTAQEAVNIMESVLAGWGGVDAFDILWSDGASQPFRSLRAQPRLFMLPNQAQRLHLADGEVVEEQEASYIPFVTRGELRGWIALANHIPFDQTLTLWTAQCASTLVMSMPAERPENPDATPEPSNRSSEVRFSFRLDELGDQVMGAIRNITSSPRILLGQVDAEHRRVLPWASHGLPSRSNQDRQTGIDYDEWFRMVKRSMPLGMLTFHVGQHPLLSSFRSAVVVQIPGLHDLPEGVIVIDASEHSLPLAHDIVSSIETVARQASSALGSARVYTDQQQTVDRLTALNALSLAMSTSQLSVEDLLNMALAGAVGTTGGEGGGAVIAWKGRPSQAFGSRHGVHVDPAWAEQFVATDRDYVEFDATTLDQSLVDHGVQYVLIAPLRGTNMTMGVLWSEYAHASIDQAQREMIVLYAKMAGSVLENMYLDELVVSTRDRLQSILSSAHEGMVLIDEHGRVGVVNRAFGRLLDIDETTWQGRHMDDFCGDNEVLGIATPTRIEICDRVRDVLHGRLDNATGDLTLDARALTWQVLPVRGATTESNGALLVIHDVTAERRMEGLRQDLSNMIVHDLRSPLTNIMVSVDLLLKQSTGTLTDAQHRILQIASSSCQQMLDLVNALLDVRRLQQQTIELQRQPIEIVDLADIVLQRLEQIAQDKRINLGNQLGALPLVMADPDMMRRVLQNLVDNALKFSRPSTMVTLSGTVVDADRLPAGHARGRWVVVAVQDHGVGIPEQYHRVIFELFTQAPGGYGRGTGVGLAFCKLAVEAHGGQIWIDSAPGEGTTFSFSLPAA